MSAIYLLARVEDIADCSALMLGAARAGNWEEVDRLKQRASVAIDEVRALSVVVSLSADERRFKLALMQRILANDGQIQLLSEPWLSRVARWLVPGRSASLMPGSRFEGLSQ